MTNQQVPESLRPIQRFYRGNDCMAENQAGDWVRYEDHVAALVEAQQPAPSAAAATEVENLRKALQFYADKEHFTIADDGAWDTVSGEPQNYWCDEEGTATVEDGTIARLALAGHQIKFEADASTQPSPTPQPDPQQPDPSAAAFDEHGFRDWVLRNLPKGSIIGNGEWWADHLTSWAKRFVKAAPQPSPTPQADSQPAAQQKAPADELEEVLRERDDAEDFINELLDEVLGADRPEWSSAYNRYDAMNDVRERITALHKPAVDKAWDQFQSAMEAPQQPAPSAAVFGLRLVPVEPTDQMVQAAHHIDLSYMPGQEGADRAAIYRAMIAAAPQPAVQQWNDLIGKETHADADGLLVWRDEVDFAAPTPQADSAPLAAPADIVVLEAALRAIHQAIDLIGEPDTERLRTVRRVLRGAVVVAEDSTAPQADSQPAPIDMVLHCPKCGVQHIDASEPPVEFEPGAAQWNNPPHRSHLCHGCGHIWRPADVPTNGVKAVKTTGKADSPIAAHAPADSVTAPAGGAVAGPTRQQVSDRLSFLEGLVAEHTYTRIVDEVDAMLAPTPPTPSADSVLEDAARWFAERDNVLQSLWVLLGEAEAQADNDNNPLLKHQVEGFYRQWNALNGTTLAPRWVTRAARKQGGAT